MGRRERWRPAPPPSRYLIRSVISPRSIFFGSSARSRSRSGSGYDILSSSAHRSTSCAQLPYCFVSAACPSSSTDTAAMRAGLFWQCLLACLRGRPTFVCQHAHLQPLQYNTQFCHLCALAMIWRVYLFVTMGCRMDAPKPKPAPGCGKAATLPFCHCKAYHSSLAYTQAEYTRLRIDTQPMYRPAGVPSAGGMAYQQQQQQQQPQQPSQRALNASTRPGQQQQQQLQQQPSRRTHLCER